MSVYHVYAYFPDKPKDGVKFPETRVIDSLSCHIGAKN